MMTGFEAWSAVLRSSVRWALVAVVILPTAGVAQEGGGSGTRGDFPALGAGTRGRLRVPALRVETPVEVDGALDPAMREGARPLSLPFEVYPGDNRPAPVETRCRVAYDQESLYMTCRALDPEPEGIRAYITDRDDIDGQDRIIFTVDPFNDGRRAFQFGVSALGVQYDAVYSELAVEDQQGAGPSDPSWDGIWSSAGRLTDDGYVVEVAIPFESLRFPATEGSQTWGFFVSRRRPRGENVDVRSMRWDRSEACMLCQANLLTGLEGVRPGGALELAPTLTARRADRRGQHPDGALVPGAVRYDAGFDATWRPTSNLTVNATVNPDFSQVEADAPQLEVNQRFALFFPEKRPFFLEGADFFSTPLRAVFTRTILDPTFGVKISGKAGANALGAVVARDRSNRIGLPGSRSSTRIEGPGGVTNVLARFRRDLGTSSTVGGLITLREGRDYHNRVAGGDAFLRLGSSLTARLQVLRSDTRYPDSLAASRGQPRGTFGGTAATTQLQYDTRRWGWGTTVRILDQGFRADAGFINQVDVASHWQWVGRRWWADGPAWYTTLRLRGGYWTQTALSDGAPVSQGVWLNLEYQGPMQSRLWINPEWAREAAGEGVFDYPRLWFGADVRPSGRAAVRLDGGVGGALDLANEREARQLRLTPSLDLRLGRKIDLGLSHAFQRLQTGGERIFTANVAQLRAIYNFSPRSFVRGIVQLRNIDRNPRLYRDPVDPSSTALATELLFSYKLNPRSVLFLGYSDARRGLVEPDGTEVPLTTTDRAFFFKLGYAWRP